MGKNKVSKNGLRKCSDIVTADNKIHCFVFEFLIRSDQGITGKNKIWYVIGNAIISPSSLKISNILLGKDYSR